MKETHKAANLRDVPFRNLRLWMRLLLLPAGLLLPCGCGKARQDHTASQPELPLVQVHTQTVENKQLATVEEVVGTIRAKLHATIEAKTTARISEMPVVLGQPVKAGELLARLNAPEVTARLEQAKANLQLSEQDWKRVSSLFNQQAATRADYDATESRYLMAKGALSEAQAMMSYVEVLAPFDGVLTRKWVDVGDLATPGKPLVEIEDPSKLQLEAEVPEAIAGKIKQGAQMTIRVGQSIAGS